MYATIRVFCSNSEAFAYACESMGYLLRTGATLPALVEDASAQFLTPTPIKITEDGRQIAVLSVPSGEGSIQVIGETASAHATSLAAGDLVQWNCGAIASGIWFGLIVGRLAPELAGRTWTLAERF